MVKTKSKTVDEIFSKIDADKKDVAERFRALIKATLPKAVKKVRLGKLTFTFNGKDFAAVRFTKAHVDLLFVNGTRLASPMLKGTGNLGDPRYIEVIHNRNFDEPEITRLLKEAAATTTVV